MRLSVSTTGTSGDPRLGMALDLSNQGRARNDVAVRVRIGLGHPGDPRPGLESRFDGGYKKVELIPGDKTSTGTFRMNLPRGSSLAFLRITPHVESRVEGDELPVDITMTDGSRTLVSSHKTVRLTTLALTTDSPKEPGVLREDRWTEVAYTVTNRSRSAYPNAQVQAEFTACPADSDDPADTGSCLVPGSRSVTPALRAQWFDDSSGGSGWKDVTAPDDGSTFAETLTVPLGALPADSTRKFRFRFEGGDGLDRDVRRLTFTARVNGKAVGASERSLGTATPLTFSIR
ncbi:hypothetical protein ACFW9L_19990 [Streptomyces sp. NPDC059517]|uniref:hypothetical protein n=1 Tax=Streptomyces sp. NPDC059517 TaxID=3346855 RepID=UPI003689AA90